MTMQPAIAEEVKLELYTLLRQFADSWALLGMTLFFLGVVLFTLRPGAKALAQDAAQIPLKED